MLHPDYPVVRGRYQMTKDWFITLPEPFNRRFERECTVLWRPGITAWISVWGNDNNEAPQERLAWIQEEASPARFDETTERGEGLLRWSYRLLEDSSDDRVAAFYGVCVNELGHVHLSVYFDHESFCEQAVRLWRSVGTDPDRRAGYGPLVTASNLLIGPQGRAVRFITRTQPSDDHDTGWVFFSGFEPEGYTDDPANFSIAPLASFLESDPTLAPLVDSPIGSTWEKTPETERWQAVEDYRLEE